MSISLSLTPLSLLTSFRSQLVRPGAALPLRGADTRGTVTTRETAKGTSVAWSVHPAVHSLLTSVPSLTFGSRVARMTEEWREQREPRMGGNRSERSRVSSGVVDSRPFLHHVRFISHSIPPGPGYARSEPGGREGDERSVTDKRRITCLFPAVSPGTLATRFPPVAHPPRHVIPLPSFRHPFTPHVTRVAKGMGRE